MDRLLKIMEANAQLSLEEMAAMAGESAGEVARRIDAYRAAGVLRGTRTLVDWDKVGGDGVQALIELRVTPKKGRGFDEIAQMISLLDEVDSVQLMSGGYDLCLLVKGATFQDVALFVSRRLAPMDDILSTATHFVLRTYKKDGAVYGAEERDERQTGLL